TSKKPNGYRCHFQPKTWAIVGMENDIVITLECRDSSNKAIPIRIDNHAMYHYKEWDGTKTQAHNADYTDNGTGADLMANDNIYTFTWRPMSNHWGQMFLEVDITYSPEDKKAHIVAAFFSSPRKPAEFTNYFREVIEDGSLVIYAGISVYTSGSYNIQANLKDVNGNYIAYATEDVKLSTGSQEVRLLFYGKILRDAEARSPYTLTSLRGYRENLPFDPELFGDPSPKALKIIQSAKTTEPDKEIIPIFKEEHKTKEYSLDEFSDKEWQSPEKDRRIQELKSIEPTSPPEIKSE
ncbi:MAG: hypothetical protein KDK45_25370, partial [Leptospiraceae bacterium]|nr:hypothetical protein [Leptospiraceae bacterium]